MKIYIYDHNRTSRSALRLLIMNQLPSASVFELQTPEEIPRGHQGADPCLLLLSWESLNKKAVKNTWIQAVKDLNPSLKVIALSGRPEVSYHTYEAGADAFVCKCDPPERLLAAVESVLHDIGGK
jgi:DNA-binding NarL/FixJ family response regulator